MNGPVRARKWVTNYLVSDLPTRLLSYRTWWGITSSDLPDPSKVYAFEPFQLLNEHTITVYTVILSTTDTVQTDWDFDSNPKYQMRHLARTYVWAKGEGSELALDRRDNMTTVVLDALLDGPAVSSYNKTQTDCSGVVQEDSIRIEYSDLTLLKGERMLAGAYISYDIEMTEVVTREALGIVSAVPSVSIRLVEKVPNAPTNLVTTEDGTSGEITLVWKAPTWDAGYSVTGYKIEQSTDSGSNWSTTTANTGTTSPTYTATGLTSSESYQFRVSGINEHGTGAASSASVPLVAP